MTKQEILAASGFDNEEDFYAAYPTPEDYFNSIGQTSPEDNSFAKGGWIQKATASIKRRGTEGVCTGSKFGGPSCRPGTRRYALAKTFRKMAKARKKEDGGMVDMYEDGGEMDAYQLMGMPTPEMYYMGGPTNYEPSYGSGVRSMDTEFNRGYAQGGFIGGPRPMFGRALVNADGGELDMTDYGPFAFEFGGLVPMYKKGGFFRKIGKGIKKFSRAVKDVGLGIGDAALGTVGSVTGIKSMQDIINEKQYSNDRIDNVAGLAGKVAGSALKVIPVTAPFAAAAGAAGNLANRAFKIDEKNYDPSRHSGAWSKWGAGIEAAGDLGSMVMGSGLLGKAGKAAGAAKGLATAGKASKTLTTLDKINKGAKLATVGLGMAQKFMGPRQQMQQMPQMPQMPNFQNMFNDYMSKAFSSFDPSTLSGNMGGGPSGNATRGREGAGRATAESIINTTNQMAQNYNMYRREDGGTINMQPTDSRVAALNPMQRPYLQPEADRFRARPNFQNAYMPGRSWKRYVASSTISQDSITGEEQELPVYGFGPDGSSAPRTGQLMYKNPMFNNQAPKIDFNADYTPFAMGGAINYPEGLQMQTYAEGGKAPTSSFKNLKEKYNSYLTAQPVTKYFSKAMPPHPKDGSMDPRGTVVGGMSEDGGPVEINVESQEANWKMNNGGNFITMNNNKGKLSTANALKHYKNNDKLALAAVFNNTERRKAKLDARSRMMNSMMNSFNPMAMPMQDTSMMGRNGGMLRKFDLGGGTGGLNTNNPAFGGYTLPSSFTEDLTYPVFPSVSDEFNFDYSIPPLNPNTSVFGGLDAQGNSIYNFENFPSYSGEYSPNPDLQGEQGGGGGGGNFWNTVGNIAGKAGDILGGALPFAPVAWNMYMFNQMKNQKKLRDMLDPRFLPENLEGITAKIDTTIDPSLGEVDISMPRAVLETKDAERAMRRGITDLQQGALYNIKQAGLSGAGNIAARTSLANAAMRNLGDKLAPFYEAMANRQAELDQDRAKTLLSARLSQGDTAMKRRALQLEAQGKAADLNALAAQFGMSRAQMAFEMAKAQAQSDFLPYAYMSEAMKGLGQYGQQRQMAKGLGVQDILQLGQLVPQIASLFNT